MPQSLSSILVHLIFSTKNREPLIAQSIAPELYAYMTKIFRECKSPSLLIGGTRDHVHALFSLSRTMDMATLVEEVKTSTSKWVKTQGEEFGHFYWQTGYGAFSISQSHVAVVKRYIANQEEHHRRRTFEDEFREFLKRYEVPHDERYVWD